MAFNLRRLTTIAALLIGALLPSAAQAATLYITEYANIGSIGTNTTPWPPGPSLATQTVAVGGASVQSTAFGAQSKAVLVMCDIGCSVLFGSSPTATTTTTLLQQGEPYVFVVAPTQKIAVIANPAGDTPGSGGAPVAVTCGVTATDLCKAEDAVAVTGDTGVAALGVVTDGATPLAAVGDYSWFGTDAAGNTQTVGVGVSGTPAGGVLTIQGQPSMEPVVVSCETGTTSLCQAEDATAATGDTGIAAFAVQQSAPADAAGNGDYASPQMSGGGLWTQPVPTATAAAGVTSVVSSAAESNHVIKASAGNLFGFSVTTGATAGYVFVSNTTTAPTAGGAAIAPIKCYVVAANSTLGVTFKPPLSLSTGITLVFSSTGCFTNTASATAFISGDAK